MNFYKCASTCRLKFLTFEFLQRELVTSDMLLEICTSAALVLVQTSNLQSPGVSDGGQPKSAPFRATPYDQKDWEKTTLINQKFENM
jgi:hypothetical protein